MGSTVGVTGIVVGTAVLTAVGATGVAVGGVTLVAVGAGGGEELGGARGLSLYLQRVALQGPRPLLEQLAAKS